MFVCLSVLVVIGTMFKGNSDPLMSSGGSSGASFDILGRYIMKNFDEAKPMSSFLAGLGGKPHHPVHSNLYLSSFFIRPFTFYPDLYPYIYSTVLYPSSFPLDHFTTLCVPTPLPHKTHKIYNSTLSKVPLNQFTQIHAPHKYL